MAPTELLAEQHARVLSRWFEPLGIRVCLLTGSQPARTRRNALLAAASGSAQLCVGTHALFQQQVRFRRPGAGDHRRAAPLRRAAAPGAGRQGHAPDDGPVPHQLIMSATPIPRTLAMTLYADLDVSVIDELPPGRTPVRTVVVARRQARRRSSRASMQACRAGRQAYWVCPLIEESEELDCQAAEETAVALAEALPALRVELLHGRMAPKQKEQIMQRFVGRRRSSCWWRPP